MEKKTNKLAQFKQWVLSIVMVRYSGKKTVHMKNGKKFFLSQVNADKLVENIQGGGAQFQSFSDKENLFVMINMQDVSYID